MKYIHNKEIKHHLKRMHKLKHVLLRAGHKERTHTYMTTLYTILKKGLLGQAVINKYPLVKKDEKTPLQIINKCLYNLMPAFIFQRVLKGGKLFELPIPVSDNRASFLASSWLHKTIVKQNKTSLTVPYRLANEISASLYGDGFAKEFLKAHIDIAIDQRPFNHYIRRKRRVISRSRNNRIARRLVKIYRIRRRHARRHNSQTKKLSKFVNKHQGRDYRSKQRNKYQDKYRKYYKRNKHKNRYPLYKNQSRKYKSR